MIDKQTDRHIERTRGLEESDSKSNIAVGNKVPVNEALCTGKY